MLDIKSIIGSGQIDDKRLKNAKRSQSLVPVYGTYKDALLCRNNINYIVVGLWIHTDNDILWDEQTETGVYSALTMLFKNYLHEFQIFCGTRSQDLSPYLESLKAACQRYSQKIEILKRIMENLPKLTHEVYQYALKTPEESHILANTENIMRQVCGADLKSLDSVPGQAPLAIRELLRDIHTIIKDLGRQDENGNYVLGDEELNQVASTIKDFVSSSIGYLEHYINLIIRRGQFLEQQEINATSLVRQVVILMSKPILALPISKGNVENQSAIHNAYMQAIQAREQMMSGIKNAGFQCNLLSSEDLLRLIADLYNKPLSWRITPD
ncbi:MAG: hypothetical protein D6735_13150 [Acidobacteria bacterium]|nr:MAG: hypothetical protein D6735_13150 [Acidobacteriota bacterium]